MKVGKKIRDRARLIVRSVESLVGTDESLFERWDNALERLVELRFVRASRSVSLNRTIPMEEKVSFFKNILSGSGESLPENVGGFLELLIREDLWNLLPCMREEFRSDFFLRTGQEEVFITSSEPFPQPEKSRLVQILSGSLGGRKVRDYWTVDPRLIGGLTIRVGTHVWDGSLKGRLNQMRQELLEEG
jgi:F-type H+-transporting ATPase subunit delta